MGGFRTVSQVTRKWIGICHPHLHTVLRLGANACKELREEPLLVKNWILSASRWKVRRTEGPSSRSSRSIRPPCPEGLRGHGWHPPCKLQLLSPPVSSQPGNIPPTAKPLASLLPMHPTPGVYKVSYFCYCNVNVIPRKKHLGSVAQEFQTRYEYYLLDIVHLQMCVIVHVCLS